MIKIVNKVSHSGTRRDESGKEMGKENAGAAPKENDARSAHSVKIVGNDSGTDDEKIVSNTEPRASVRLAGTFPARRNRARTEEDIAHSDPYVALRIADTPRARRSSGLLGSNEPYMPLRFADTSKRTTKSTVVPSTDPYMSLRVAPSNHFQSRSNGKSVIHDSSGSEESASDSDRSRYDQVDDDEKLSEFGGDADSEDIDKDFPKFAKVSAGDSETEDGRKFPGYARVSVAGSEMDYGRESDREFLGHARAFVGSEGDNGKDGDQEFSGYARVSVAGSDTEYGRDVHGGFAGLARVSVEGSEIQYGKDMDKESSRNARVSVAGSEIEYENDVGTEHSGYARVSVAGSEAEYGEWGHGRVSNPGSETDYARDRYPRGSHTGSDTNEVKEIYARVSLVGSDTGNIQDTYARLSVAGSAAEYGRGVDWDFSDPARVSTVRSEGDAGTDVYAEVDVAERGEELESESDHGETLDTEFSGYARVSVVEGDANSQNYARRDVSGYARLTVMRSDADSTGTTGIGVESISHKFGHPYQEELALSHLEDKGDQGSWNKENQAYMMKLDLQNQAKLKYRVRVVLISPLFEQNQRKLCVFSDIYMSKFGTDIESTEFSSVASLCYAMPDVVQRKSLEEKGELFLVDSSENRRAVSGIRSGLRRIVYDALKSFCKDVTYSQLEEKCSELLGKPLVEVLTEHGYDPPKLESLVKDMADITGLLEVGLESYVYLYDGAEDPALTDGLLIKSTAGVSMTSTNTQKSKEVMLDQLRTAKGLDESGGHLKFQPEISKVVSAVTLRSLKNELRRFGVHSCASAVWPEHEILQCRLRMRILLAFHNFGHGVEIQELPELYLKTFGRSLDLQELGFTTLVELARHWQDIFLLQELKPNWVFLAPSLANRRILNTLRMGLRSSVYSVLLKPYPEGLDPLDFLHHLQEVMVGELWEVLEATGYICSEGETTSSILTSIAGRDFQLANFDELCILLDDMIDFVQLGSNEDGSVVVKLRNGEPPLVDLMQCNLEEKDLNSFDELFVNLMMIAVDNTETSGAEDGFPDSDVFINVGHVQSLVKSFEGIAGLRSAHSQTPDSLRLKHEIRLILGCPEYFENGLSWNELSAVYRDRTGHELGSRLKVKSLLRGMPDVVHKDSLVGDYACLSRTPSNLRILSATRAGLRQILFWAILKNPGGVWANLLEGWFTDFAGMSLAATLQIHGYETSKTKPFFPVHDFLRDMSDLLQKKSASLEVYRWAGELTDPVHSDASLLGLSELEIQYNPVKWKSEKLPRGDIEMVKELKGKPTLNGFKEEIERREFLGCDSLENPGLKEVGVEAYLEDEVVLEVRVTEETSDSEAQVNHEVAVESLAKEENEKLQMQIDSGKPVHDGDNENVAVGCMDGDLLHNEVAEGQEGRYVEETTKDETPSDMKENLNGDIQEEMQGDNCRVDTEAAHELGIGESTVQNALEEDDETLLQVDSKTEMGTLQEGSETNTEAYTQLRVAGKGPKVNLDEWQFTDSEEEDDEYSNHDDDDDDELNDDSDFQEGSSEYSEIEETSKEQSKTLPADPYVAPKVKEAGKDTNRAWVLPNKIIPWK